MTRATLILHGKQSRAQAAHWAHSAPSGTVVEFRRPTRSTPQNSRMWAMLTCIAQATDWHGVKLAPDDWKLIFMAALNREMRIVPNLDGTGFVNLGTRTSKLSKSEHSDLTMLIEKFADERGIDLMEGESV